MRCNASVVLPAPFGPSSATRSPALDAQTDAEQRLVAVRIDVREIADLERGNGHDRIHAVAATNAAPTGKSIATPQAAVASGFDVVAGMVPS